MLQPVPIRPPESFEKLSAARRAEWLLLAIQGSHEAAFDWTLADDQIIWEGSRELLPYHHDREGLTAGSAFRTWMSEAGRGQLQQVLQRPVENDTSFSIEFEAASALGTDWFEMRGVRLLNAEGRPERLIGLLRLDTERVRAARRLHYLATRDELTGHLNRTSLCAELTSAIEAARVENRCCAFLKASVDRLGTINDAYGFGAADEVIVAVGERIAASLRGSDVIGRTTGNKFGVILANCSERELSVVAERLRAAVRKDVIATRSGVVSATISIGALCLPANASTAQEAMQRAAEALEEARAKGRDSFAVYTTSAQRESARMRLMAVADETIAALHDRRLVFAYQPIVSAQTREIAHHECLLRMVRADGAVLGAGYFIPAAEQLGLVRLVDRHALEMMVAKLHAHPSVNLAVNVSGTTARDPSWLQSFVEYVRANQSVAPRLIVELTETAALHDFEESARFISGLRELGCRVAIDDFGAGYTSFRNLKMLRVDMVKIDGAYVRDLANSPENQIFVRSLVDLAKNFKLETVAEWVGSEEDAELLHKLGVDYLQGFHIGEPRLDPDWLSATS